MSVFFSTVFAAGSKKLCRLFINKFIYCIIVYLWFATRNAENTQFFRLGSWQLASYFLTELSPDVVTFGRITSELESWSRACALLEEKSRKIHEVKRSEMVKHGETWWNLVKPGNALIHSDSECRMCRLCLMCCAGNDWLSCGSKLGDFECCDLIACFKVWRALACCLSSSWRLAFFQEVSWRVFQTDSECHSRYDDEPQWTIWFQFMSVEAQLFAQSGALPTASSRLPCPSSVTPHH